MKIKMKTKFKVWHIHCCCFLEEFTDRGGSALLYKLPLERAKLRYEREESEDEPYPYATLSNVFSCPDFYIPLQYTGLCDKEGKEIFEGDIILIEEEDVKFVVKWSEKYACFYCSQLWKGRDSSDFNDVDDFEEFEFTEFRNSFPLSVGIISQYCNIIGNIYENPELLIV